MVGSDPGLLGENGLTVEEFVDVCDNAVRVLEQRSVTGVGVDDEFGVRNTLRHQIGVDRGHHDVVAAIDDKRWLANAGKLLQRIASCLIPIEDGCNLGIKRLAAGWPIWIRGARVSASPECSTRGPARR
jgi:hypothetical protein